MDSIKNQKLEILKKWKKNQIESWHEKIRKSGRTQKQVAALAGITYHQFNKILRGRENNPHLASVNKVNNVLNNLK